jgi:PPOX class probable F420-dependent enzyme
MPGGRRASVAMTPEEVEGFLRASKKVHVATVNPDGSPHLTTLFHVVLDGRIGFWTYASSQKVKNLERDARVTCLVEDGDDYFELRGVAVTGTAELVRDETRIREIGSLVAARMVHGADLGDAGRAEVERQVAKRVGVLVTADRVASWDHRKLTTGPGQS